MGKKTNFIQLATFLLMVKQVFEASHPDTPFNNIVEEAREEK